MVAFDFEWEVLKANRVTYFVAVFLLGGSFLKNDKKEKKVRQQT